MNMIFELWNAMLISAAVTSIIVIALGLLIRVIEPLKALRRIGATIGCMVILVMLPPIIVHLWHSLSLWQQIGVAFLIFMAAFVWNRRTKATRTRNTDH